MKNESVPASSCFSWERRGEERRRGVWGEVLQGQVGFSAVVETVSQTITQVMSFPEIKELRDESANQKRYSIYLCFLWCLDVFSVDLARLESVDSPESLPRSRLLSVSRLEYFLRRSMSCRRSSESPLFFLLLACRQEIKRTTMWPDFGLIQSAAQLSGQNLCWGGADTDAKHAIKDTWDWEWWGLTEAGSQRSIHTGHVWDVREFKIWKYFVITQHKTLW